MVSPLGIVVTKEFRFADVLVNVVSKDTVFVTVMVRALWATPTYDVLLPAAINTIAIVSRNFEEIC